MGGDLGSALKSFRSAVSDKEEKEELSDDQAKGEVIEGRVESHDEDSSNKN